MNNELLIGSKEIYDKAVADFKPKATVLMFSGGDDSLTAYEVGRELGIKFDFVIHGNTRTGIEETTLFARETVEKMGDRYIEADAGDSYIDYVMRKGFFGKGLGAHAFSYHVLKIEHFRKVVSKYLRQRQRNFPILFINGARRLESENRKKTMLIPYKKDPAQKNNIWVNLINEWDKRDCKAYLEGNSICRNAVSVALCRSGECMCGTMQSKGDRIEAAYFYPEWGKWIDGLDKAVREKHGFGWGENKVKPSKFRQLELFQPMCVGCTKNEESYIEHEDVM
jgi:3''-phosphoadenosine 5''-phosphosulfate sulfotransferase (PAPS reductase)/FAD synthetase and related enzymes